MRFLQLDPTGVYVVGHGEAKVAPAGTIPLQASMNVAEFLGCYLVDGVLTPRPNSPAPIAVSGGWRIDAPTGAVVEVYDLIGEEIMVREAVAVGGSYAFALPDAGRYQVSVSAPLPAMPCKVVLEVS